MMKTFNIDNNRILNLVENNDEIHILDKTTMKAAVFTPARWASFMLCLGEIHDQVCKLIEGAHVAYLNHYGGGWHVTVSRGLHGADLRKFYVPLGETSCKPTSMGITLSVTEWLKLREVIRFLHRDNPSVTDFLPCTYNHSSPQGLSTCQECNPFPTIIM